MKKIKNSFKKFRDFLKKDTWPSFLVVLAIAFIIIKFFFFPLLSLVTGTSLPLVIVESCSMHHYEKGFNEIFIRSNVYDNNNIDIQDTSNWDFQNGFNKGDVIFVVGAKKIEKGNVIIFNGGAQHPIIHRVVSLDPLETKGDNYKTNSRQLSAETNILRDQVVGKALFRVPFIGWLKLIFFEPLRDPSERGMCT